MALYTFHTGIIFFFSTELFVMKILSVTLEPLYYQLPCLSYHQCSQSTRQKFFPGNWLSDLVYTVWIYNSRTCVCLQVSQDPKQFCRLLTLLLAPAPSLGYYYYSPSKVPLHSKAGTAHTLIYREWPRMLDKNRRIDEQVCGSLYLYVLAICHYAPNTFLAFPNLPNLQILARTLANTAYEAGTTHMSILEE